MNQSIRENQALAYMRLRAQGLNDAARKSAGLPPAERQPRFQVHPKGGSFNVVERRTGVVRQVCPDHRTACAAADKHEARTETWNRRTSNVARIGRQMLVATLVLSATLTAFAFYGGHGVGL